MSITFILLTLLFLAVSVAMILLILVQRPQGGGLAGAFGGAGGGGTDTAFGGRTGDALTVATVGAFTAFLVLGAVINIIGNPRATAEAQATDAGLLSPELVDTNGGAARIPSEFTGSIGGDTPVTDAPVEPIDPAFTTRSTLPPADEIEPGQGEPEGDRDGTEQP